MGLDDSGTKDFIIALLGLLTSAGIFRGVLSARKARREDKAGVRDDEAEETSSAIWERTVKRLEREVEQLTLRINDMNKQMLQNITERLDALAASVDMRHRVAELEKENRFQMERMSDMTAQISSEIQLRVKAVSESDILRQRVADLENELAQLKRGIVDPLTLGAAPT